ncbi:MAG: hypothetical protein S0880_09780 [Actinomycetota bacterium]|nr:hypothetical protein [Actinomycetota bacterium]
MAAPVPPPVLAAAVLRSRGIDAVIIGGTAEWLHTGVGMPRDLDLAPAPTPANLAALTDGLTALGASPDHVPTADVLARTDVRSVPTAYGPVDVLAGRGRDEHHLLTAQAHTVTVLGVGLSVASLGDVLRLRHIHGYRPTRVAVR